MAEFIAGEKIEAGNMVYVGADGKVRRAADQDAIDEASVGLYAKLAASFWGRAVPVKTQGAEAAPGGSWRDRPPML